MSGVEHFLVADGPLHAAVSWTTVLLLGWLVKLVRDHVRTMRAAHGAALRHQREIRTLLDTSKPGGLTDVVRAIDDQMAPPCHCHCECDGGDDHGG